MSSIRIDNDGRLIRQICHNKGHGLTIQDQVGIVTLVWWNHGKIHGPAIQQWLVGEDDFTYYYQEWHQHKMANHQLGSLDQFENILWKCLNYSSDSLTPLDLGSWDGLTILTGARIVWGLSVGSRSYPVTQRDAQNRDTEVWRSSKEDYPKLVPRQARVNGQMVTLYSVLDPWLEQDHRKLVYFALALDCDVPILEALSLAFKNPLAIPIIEFID